MQEPSTQFQLVVGFTASNVGSSHLLLNDLSKFSSTIKGITKLVICDNSDDPQSIQNHLKDFREQGVSIRFVPKEEVSKSAREGELGEYYKETVRQIGIAFGRTALHRYLYLASLGLDNPIVWILDDDVRLDASYFETPHKFTEQLCRLRAEGTYSAFGRVNGDPSIPAASMIRTQLLDLDFNLRALRNPDFSVDPEELELQKRENIQKYPDYYYDLSLRHAGHLETPWWFLGEKGSTDRLELLQEMLEKIPQISKGVNIFRQLPSNLPPEPVSDRDIITRGGNTFVFNIDCLRDYPNIAPQVKDLAFRRGDTLWVTLNRRLNSGSRKISIIDLPVRQDRRYSKDTIHQSRSLLSDVLGSAFTRAVDEVLAKRDTLQNGSAVYATSRLTNEEISDIIRIFDRHLKDRFTNLQLNSWRIIGLIDSIRTQIRVMMENASRESVIMQRYADSIEGLLKSVEDIYSPEAVRNLRQIASSYPHSELESFLRNLDYYCRSYRDRLPASNKSHEIQGVISFLQDHFGNRQFELLAEGNEGFLLTDGAFVYKYFYDGIPNFQDGQLKFLRNVLSSPMLSGLNYILPLEKVLMAGPHSVFVTKLVKGHAYAGGLLNHILGLVRECKQAGIVLTNISPENLIATDDSLVYVDLGRSVKPFDQNSYREMCKRAFLVYKWHFRSDLKDLLRRALYDDSLPELFGFDHFLAALNDKDVHEELDEVLLFLIHRNKPERILDYGCGNGVIADKLAKSGVHVTAYDIDPLRYERHTHSSGVTFTGLEGIRSLLASGSTFDVVLCNLVLCTVDDHTAPQIIADLRRLVDSEGTVILGLCNSFDLENRESETHVKQVEGAPRYSEHFIYRKTVKLTHGTRTEVHRPFSWYSTILRRAGFEISELVEVPSTDISKLSPGSDFLLLVLKPVVIPRPSNVSLLIKASAMEWRTIRQQVTHLVRQLEGPKLFLEKVVVVDNYEGPFARQYDIANLSKLKEELALLVEQGIIDRLVVAPHTEPIVTLTKKWFGLDVYASRCRNGQPTLTTLYGFEQCRGEYILHIDSDCLIGRRVRNHEYLSQMLQVFRDDPRAITVSLPIAGRSRMEYSAGNENGKWRTEARCGIISKSRLDSILPLRNRVTRDGLLELPWHRALDLKLKESVYQSYRGGDPTTFFVHVPNSRKKDFNSWYNVMKAVEKGQMPDSQVDKVDLVGRTEDWMPKRSEDCILIVRGRNVPISKLRRCFNSLLRQSDQNWGLLVVDAASDNGMGEYIEEVIARRYGSRMTFYRNLVPDPPIANIDFAIRHLCSNDQSIIIMPDADDAFLCTDAIEHVKSAYAQGADIAIGGLLRTDKEVRYPTNFHEPRQNRGGNVWQPLRTFRKYLFDSIDPEDLKVDGIWVPHTEDWAFMLPMAELATAPTHLTRTVYLYEPSSLKQTLSKQERESLIGRIVSRPSYRRS